MADDVNGNYTLESSLYSGDNIFQQQKAAGLKASAAHIDSLMVDIKNALNARLNIDGSKPMTSDLNMGLNAISNVTDMQSDTITTGSGTFSGTITVDTNITGPYATISDTLTSASTKSTTFCMGAVTVPVGTNAYNFLDDVEGGTLLQLQTEHNNLIAALAAVGIIQTI